MNSAADIRASPTFNCKRSTTPLKYWPSKPPEDHLGVRVSHPRKRSECPRVTLDHPNRSDTSCVDRRRYPFPCRVADAGHERRDAASEVLAKSIRQQQHFSAFRITPPEPSEITAQRGTHSSLQPWTFVPKRLSDSDRRSSTNIPCINGSNSNPE